MKYWGKFGAFWGGLWGLLFGAAFLFVPGLGQVVVAGPLVASIIAGLEGAIAVGGLSAIGAALFSIGIPKDSVVRYEVALNANQFLLIAHGTADEVARAREILQTGPWGLGLLRASPAIGAGSMALLLAHRPFRSRAGATMLWCVAGFGAFTVLFGVSRSLILSMVALMLVGSMDMVSVVVRSTLVQLATPDEMRGRVSAVEMIFIGASNEIGQFESGITAQWFGTEPAVIMGGIGTLLVTALWALSFPELRRVEQLTAVK
jgi:hypothetical protein